MAGKLKIAFPHMGTVYIIWASLIKAMGGEVVIPPKTSKKTLSIGTKNSPEAICLPYKLVLGNFIEAIEAGADMVVMISSPGICRLGEYGRSAKNALDDLGYKVKYMDIDLYKGKIAEIYRCLITLTGNRNPFRLLKAIYVSLSKVFVLDRLENMLSYYRAREMCFGTAEKVYNKAIGWVFDATSSRDLKKAEKGDERVSKDSNR